MVSINKLKRMSEAPGEGKAYFRPFICNGEYTKADIFFVGINPATPIYPNEMDIDAYVNLLLNYQEFIHYYKSSRIKQDKDEISRTRIGINSFLSWISQFTNSPVIETDIIPYPTPKLKDLKKEPKYVKEKGKDIFYQLVMELHPRLLILHGKKTVEYTIETFLDKGIIKHGKVDLDKSIEQMEQEGPLIDIIYPNGKKGHIMPCRHFMYYGTKGDSFKNFKQKILSML